MPQKLVPLSKIKDNPWRDRMRNPVDPDRVDAIAASIDKTGEYWEGTYGREVEGGFVELAFGHHRADAARKQGLKEIPVTIRKFDDGEMLVWMAQENVRGELPVVIEAVAAAVKALGEGKIQIEAPDPKTKTSAIRYAPSFLAKDGSSPTVGDHPYTVKKIAEYLGFTKQSTGEAKNSVVAAMGILERAEIASLEGGKEGVEKAVRLEKSFVEQCDPEKLAKMKVNEALKALSDIKNREAKVKERQEKTAAEIAEINEKQRILKEKAKEREAKEQADREELIRKRTEAVAEENREKAKKLQEKLKAQAEAAEAKAEADKVKMQALEAKVEAKKAAAEEQRRKEDEYLPIRKEVDRIVHILERRDLAESIKALSRKPLTLRDRERIWEAIDGLAAWLSSWAAAQFNGPVGGRVESKRRKN